MIKHQVELDLYTERIELMQIIWTHKFLVDVVIDYRKPSIQVAVEERGEDVEQRKGILELGPFE